MRVILMTNRFRLSMQMRGRAEKANFEKRIFRRCCKSTVYHRARCKKRAGQEAVNVVFASKPPFKITKMLEMAPTDGQQGERRKEGITALFLPCFDAFRQKIVSV